MRQRSFGFQTIASEQTFMWRSSFNICSLYWTSLNTFVAVLLVKLLYRHSSQLSNDRNHMWALRSVVTSTHVQCRSLVIEYARLNKPYRYGNKNLSKVNKKGIGAGWRHCPRPLNNDFGQVFIQNKTLNQNAPLLFQSEVSFTKIHELQDCRGRGSVFL